MTENKKRPDTYTGIDIFRLTAAFLVVAIHTSPLSSFSEAWDFFLTRILARTAVPFFFMTSGFFVISGYDYRAQRLGRFVKRTVLLYGLASLLYIPVNVYSGYFAQENLLPNLLKDIVFDGTFYHLWYLPASAIGAVIAWYLVRKLDFNRALCAAGLLYLAGLPGDSYYGLAEKVPLLRGFYELVFQVSDYTRNGIFLAPLFFVLGSLLAERPFTISFRKSAFCFACSFLLMSGEAMILRTNALQRHDSMYLFLPVCMVFLFRMILRRKGKRNYFLSRLSLLIYVTHPMMILVVRLFAKITGLRKLLIENSVLHYLAVSVLSFGFSAAWVLLWKRMERKWKKDKPEKRRVWTEISLRNLRHNVKVLQTLLPPKGELMAVVKADAYGHGDFEISTALERMGVKAFAVATFEEGVRLRNYGIRGEILILGYTAPERAKELKKYRLIQTVIDFEYAKALNRQEIPVKVHIKTDTGMHRLGIESGEPEKVRKVFDMDYLKVCGIYTHLCCADSLLPEDIAFTGEQIARFYHVTDRLKEWGVKVPKLHIQSSYGLLNYPELRCDYARVGIALYGVLSEPGQSTLTGAALRPVLSLKTRVVLIRKVPKGESIGYGRACRAERNLVIAILSVGYGDGFPRSLSCGRGGAFIRGGYAPVAGRICMDQLAVDVTDLEKVCVGDIATLIGAEQGEELSAEAVAKESGSISNELLCRLGERAKG